MSLYLILLAAGKSKRLKSNTPKPYQSINNKTLLEHSFNSFKNIKEIKKIVIVYNKKHKKYLDNLPLKNTIKVIGGKTRQESTLIGLKRIEKMNCKKVLIHDSARPSPPEKLVRNIIFALKKNHAAVPLIKVADATKRIKGNKIFKNIERNTLRLAQTPQGFDFKNIYKMHLLSRKILIDDDVSLLISKNKKIAIIPGSSKNFKITNKEDLDLYKKIKAGKFFSGIGFDVHRLAPKRKLYLGGVYIKSKLGTLGHSDGDPVLHAIIDAILGAIQMGDIGEKFSDKNKKFKNIRSTILLENVIEEIKSQNFYIKNIDLNIITQTPKIQKYKKKIIKSISTICKISDKTINIKGKTTEKLGVIGKEKAIACEALVSLVKYD